MKTLFGLKSCKGENLKKSIKSNKLKVVEINGFEPMTSSMPWKKRASKQVEKDSEPTVLVPGQKYKTPYNYSLIPKIEWSNGRAEIFLLVSKDLNARSGKVVESRRVRKSKKSA